MESKKSLNLIQKNREEIQVRRQESLESFSTAIKDQKGLEWVNYTSSLSVRQANEFPTLLNEHIKADKKVILSLVSLLIQLEVSSWNFTKTMNDIQIVECAGNVLEKYVFETLEDIVLAFKYFKQNRLSYTVDKMFKVSSLEILRIIDTYMLEVKIPDRENMHRERANKNVAIDPKDKATPEQVRNYVQKYMREAAGRKAEWKAEKVVNKDKSILNSSEFLENELYSKFSKMDSVRLESVASEYKHLHERVFVEKIINRIFIERGLIKPSEGEDKTDTQKQD